MAWISQQKSPLLWFSCDESCVKSVMQKGILSNSERLASMLSVKFCIDSLMKCVAFWVRPTLPLVWLSLHWPILQCLDLGLRPFILQQRTHHTIISIFYYCHEVSGPKKSETCLKVKAVGEYLKYFTVVVINCNRSCLCCLILP